MGKGFTIRVVLENLFSCWYLCLLPSSSHRMCKIKQISYQIQSHISFHQMSHFVPTYQTLIFHLFIKHVRDFILLLARLMLHHILSNVFFLFSLNFLSTQFSFHWFNLLHPPDQSFKSWNNTCDRDLFWSKNVPAN